ncbi:tetratricopeptide repeat protein [Streptomyces europaeiscabiei]|uniref:tetratricopeptide repeat protein n=1 Tax=Streptomyces europaeiscabiei TaxID=146819 RepID=UPI0029A69756|nr:transcriptional regulator [Streptomyces europaeiscabiei]MDX2525236.1 transcriptional regulator [Streptomyces europaeiscabiei]
MGETAARDRLAGELRKLQDASGLSYTQIEMHGRNQTPVAKLGRSKLSGWLKGDYVPEGEWPFQYLIRLLEARAEKKGVPPKGINWWRDRRKEAADERDASAVSKEPADRSAQLVAPAVAAPHVGDVAKAARLLRLLPLNGSWLRWLENAETMFKVPLTVSNLVCDAHRPLETDRPDYVDPELQEAHREFVETLGTLCFELNGMNNISDEGQDVLEISYPGTSSERNELNRQACRARDEFIPAYTRVINLLNAKGLLPPAPAGPSTSLSSSVPPAGSRGGTPTLPLTLIAEGQPHGAPADDWRQSAVAPLDGAAVRAATVVEGHRAEHDTLAQHAPGTPLDKLDPFGLEVHRSVSVDKIVPPDLPPLPLYVPRAHDRELAGIINRAASETSAMVTLIGGSSTGKTRACWEAIRALPSHWKVWHPLAPSRPEAALTGLESVGPHTVIWLNEAQLYLLDCAPKTAENVTAKLRVLLADPARGPVLVLATLWPDKWRTLTRRPPAGKEDVLSQQRELLTGIGTKLTLPDSFTHDELTTLRQLAAQDPRLAQARDQAVGGAIAQYLAGTPHLIDRYDHASAAARAVLDAAADARRYGHGPDLPLGLLKHAAVDYLTDSEWNRLSNSWVTEALDECEEPCHGALAPLEAIRPRRAPRPGTPHYKLADYLQQHTARTRRGVLPPDSFWDAAAEHVTAVDDLVPLAEAALNRGLLRQAAALYRRAAEEGHITALCDVAVLRRQAGDDAGADELYREAAAAGDTIALYQLSVLREQSGDGQGAEEYARTAATLGSTAALGVLAQMREDTGRGEDAERLAREAADAGDTRALLHIAARRGNTASAERLYLQAAEAGNATAWLELAAVRVLNGNGEGAELLYQRAAEAGDPRGLTILAVGLERRGDGENAERLARLAVEAGDRGAWGALAQERERRGDGAGAERLYELAVDARDIGAMRAFVGRRLRGGDLVGAEVIARKALEAGDPGSCLKLAKRWTMHGDREGSDRLYRLVAEAGHVVGLRIMSERCRRAGDSEGSERFAREALEAGDPGPFRDLAKQRWHGGDGEGAERLAHEAAFAGHPMVLVELGQWQEEAEGDLAGAERLAWASIAYGHPSAVQELARLRELNGRREDAVDLWRFGLNTDGTTAQPW